MHRATLDVYERIGGEYAVRRGVQDPERTKTFARSVRAGGPILDLGCGPGLHLPLLGPATVGADGAQAMVEAARSAHPANPVVRCDLADLPFGSAAFAGVWASKAHQHLPAADLPMALAEVHRVIEVGAPLELTMFSRAGVEDAEHGALEELSTEESGDDLPGRHFTWWDPQRLAEVVAGAGFSVEGIDRTDPDGEGIARVVVTAVRERTLPDFVGPGMALLCCGINPSLHAADAGVGYVTRSNRFWPALTRAGLCTVDRDPRHLLREHRIGMTRIVQRPTPRASDLARSEYREGFDRVERLCRWLQPAAMVVIGIGAWRDATGDRRATVGWQPEPVGPTPVYVMPSTSGLNAAVGLDELTQHLVAAAAGPPPP